MNKNFIGLIIFYMLSFNLYCQHDSIINLMDEKSRLNYFIDFDNKHIKTSFTKIGDESLLIFSFNFPAKLNKYIINCFSGGDVVKHNKKLNKKWISFTFNNAIMKYDKETQTYNADLIKIYKINNIFIHNILKTKLVLGNKSIIFYVENKNNEWYFFFYKDNILRTLSSNSSYNNIIRNKKNRGNRNYYYTLSSEYFKKNFVRID